MIRSTKDCLYKNKFRSETNLNGDPSEDNEPILNNQAQIGLGLSISQ